MSMSSNSSFVLSHSFVIQRQSGSDHSCSVISGPLTSDQVWKLMGLAVFTQEFLERNATVLGSFIPHIMGRILNHHALAFGEPRS